MFHIRNKVAKNYFSLFSKENHPNKNNRKVSFYYYKENKKINYRNSRATLNVSPVKTKHVARLNNILHDKSNKHRE